MLSGQWCRSVSMPFRADKGVSLTRRGGPSGSPTLMVVASAFERAEPMCDARFVSHRAQRGASGGCAYFNKRWEEEEEDETRQDNAICKWQTY